MRSARALLGVALAVSLAAAACAGPRVEASDVRVTASPLPGHQRVQATLTNRGGKGEAKVVIRLRNTTTGQILSANHTVELDRNDRVEMVVDVPAPARSYTAELDVTFPPT